MKLTQNSFETVLKLSCFCFTSVCGQLKIRFFSIYFISETTVRQPENHRQRNEWGSEFQTVGPATEKARVPKVLRWNCGIFSLRRLAERICWRPETSVGEVPWSSIRKTPMNSHGKLVYCTRCGIVSQCRSSRNSRERPRSCFWIPVIRRAVAFWTRCNLSVTYFGADARTEYYGKVKCCNNRLVMWQMNEPVSLPIQHPESDGYVSLDEARSNMSYVTILQCAPVVVLFSFFFVLATLTCHRRVHNNQKNWSWTFGRRTEIGDVRNDCAPVTVAWLMAPIVMV